MPDYGVRSSWGALVTALGGLQAAWWWLVVCGELSSAVGCCAGLEMPGREDTLSWRKEGQAASAWGKLQLRTQASFVSCWPAGVSEAAIPKAPGSLVPPLLCLQRCPSALPASAKFAGPTEPTGEPDLADMASGAVGGERDQPGVCIQQWVRSVQCARLAGTASDSEAWHGTWLERLPVRPQGPSSGLTTRGS